jgi:hypothetical protein
LFLRKKTRVNFMKPQFRLGLLLLALPLALQMFGQSNKGTITGTISDSGGAVVPGAPVVVTNMETGAKFDTVSTGTGNYSILQLPVGSYSLTIEQPGFGKFEQKNIQVEVAGTTRVDVALKIGSASDSVTITAESSSLKTESAEQSMTVTGNQISELLQGCVRRPAVGRSLFHAGV